MPLKDVINKAYNAVLSYSTSKAVAVAEMTLQEGLDPVAVINEGFTKGIREIGDLFEEKKIYLPHLIAAADAMNAAVEILMPEYVRAHSNLEDKGRVIICSVEGDIHSIGKDIVAAVLTSSGFNVFNIGRDIPTKNVIEACREIEPTALCLSALMKNTMSAQSDCIELLKKEKLRGKIIVNVGGAPVKQAWSDSIGADFYSENAADCAMKMKIAVNIKNSILSNQ